MSKIISFLAILTIITAAFNPLSSKNVSSDESRSNVIENELQLKPDSISISLQDRPIDGDALALLDNNE